MGVSIWGAVRLHSMDGWAISGEDVQAPWHGVLETVWLHCNEAQQAGCLRGWESCPTSVKRVEGKSRLQCSWLGSLLKTNMSLQRLSLSSLLRFKIRFEDTHTYVSFVPRTTHVWWMAGTTIVKAFKLIYNLLLSPFVMFGIISRMRHRAEWPSQQTRVPHIFKNIFHTFSTLN